MRKLLLAILLLPFFAHSQTIYDTATIRSRVNTQIIANGTQAITGNMLNDILNGYLNAWPDTRIYANYPLSWNAHTHTMSLTGTQTGVPSGLTININGIAQDLSVPRVWSVGTLTSIAGGWGLLGGTIVNTGTFKVDTSLVSSKAYTNYVYDAIRTRFSALSPIVYDPSTGQFSLTTVPISKGGTGLTAVGTNGQVLRSNGTGLYYFTPNWLTGSDTISLSNRINTANFTVEDPLYFNGSRTILRLDYFKNTYNARWINGIQVRPISPTDNQVLQYKAWTGMAQWMDLDSLVAAASNDYDTLALSKVITLNAGTGITIPQTAGQTLGLPPVWTVNTDTTIISTKWYVNNKFDSVVISETDPIATPRIDSLISVWSSNNNTNVGTGYRWLLPGTQGIKTVFGNMVLIDSTSNANGLTFKVDTSVVASKTWVTTNTTSGTTNNANVGSSYRWLLPGSQEIKTFHAGYGSIIDSTSFANELMMTVDTSAAGLATYNYVTNTFNTYNLAKQAKLTLTTTGTSGVSTLDGSGNLNIPNYTFEPVITAPYTTNKYWNGYKQFVALNTDSIAEGSTNKFYTDARARAAISLTTTGTGAATYSATTGVLNIPTGGGTVTQTHNITMPAPTAADNYAIFFTPNAITIQQVAEAVVGSSTPSITYTIEYGSNRSVLGTLLFSSSHTVTSVAGVTSTSFANASIPAGSWIVIKTSAISGTITELDVTLSYIAN